MKGFEGPSADSACVDVRCPVVPVGHICSFGDPGRLHHSRPEMTGFPKTTRVRGYRTIQNVCFVFWRLIPCDFLCFCLPSCFFVKAQLFSTTCSAFCFVIFKIDHVRPFFGPSYRSSFVSFVSHLAKLDTISVSAVGRPIGASACIAVAFLLLSSAANSATPCDAWASEESFVRLLVFDRVKECQGQPF